MRPLPHRRGYLQRHQERAQRDPKAAFRVDVPMLRQRQQKDGFTQRRPEWEIEERRTRRQ